MKVGEIEQSAAFLIRKEVESVAISGAPTDDNFPGQVLCQVNAGIRRLIVAGHLLSDRCKRLLLAL